MHDLPWAARLVASDGRVTVTFSRDIRVIGLSADTARQLAAKLLILAESAETSPHDDAELESSVAELSKDELCRSGCGRSVALAGYCDSCIHHDGGEHVG